MKRTKQYALDGARYATSCISKYSSQGSSGSTLPDPIGLPINAKSSANYQALQGLKDISAPKRKTGMEWAKEFVANYKKENKRMSWKNCYELRLAEGYFKSYKNFQSLKATYHGWVNNQTEQTEQPWRLFFIVIIP
jgi:hypothetical protein